MSFICIQSSLFYASTMLSKVFPPGQLRATVAGSSGNAQWSIPIHCGVELPEIHLPVGAPSIRVFQILHSQQSHQGLLMGKSSAYCNRLIRCPQGSNYQFVLRSLTATIAPTGVEHGHLTGRRDIAQPWRKDIWQTVRRAPDPHPWGAILSALPPSSVPSVAYPVYEHHFQNSVWSLQSVLPRECFFHPSLVSLYLLLVFHGPLVK